MGPPGIDHRRRHRAGRAIHRVRHLAAANTSYYSSTSYGYNLFTVVPTVKITAGNPNEDHGLVSLFVGATSPLCSSAQEAIMNTFGFDDLTAAEGTCGAPTSRATAAVHRLHAPIEVINRT